MTRRLILFTVILAALVLGLALNGVMAWRGAPPALPVAPVRGHGALLATVDLGGLTPGGAAQIVRWAADDGHRFLRLRLPWSEIEPQPGDFRWDTADAAVAVAREQGLETLLLLDGSPGWAVAPVDAGNPLAPPHDVRNFGRFAAAVAQRYGAEVDLYQIWDEPNIAPHWGARWVSPQGYFNLLREARNSIQATDPAAAIMLAALAPTTASDGNNMSDLVYLEQLYELGAAALFELAAGQSYGFSEPPDAGPAPDRLNFRRPELVHGIMAAHGDAGKPLWITAWGWWTGEAAAASPWGGVDGATAAAYQQAGLAFARSRWPWAGPLGWADYVITPGRDPRRSGFALRDPEGAPTPLGQSLASATPPATLGAGSHALTADGVSMDQGAWRFSPAAADPSEPGSALAVPFTGRAVAVEVQRGPYWAALHAWIDGQPAPLLPRDEAGRAYIALHDPANSIETVPLARDLAPGLHELRLEASAGWGQWPLRRLIIDSQPWPQPWPFWPIAAVFSVAAVAAAWFWWNALRSPSGRQAVSRLLAIWDRVSAEATLVASPSVWLAALLAVSVGLYLAPPAPWLSLLLLAVIATGFALRLDLAPAVILAWLPFYIEPKSFGPAGVPLHELFIWLAFGLWLLRRALAWAANPTGSAQAGSQPPDGPSWRRLLASLDTPVLLLLVVAAFATLNASRSDFALYDWRTVFLTPAVFYLLVTRTHRDRSFDLSVLADGLVAGAVAISILALVQVAAGRGAAVEGVLRASGLYGSANNLALYLGRVLPLLIATAGLRSLRPSCGEAPRPQPDRRRLLYALALLPVATAAFLTFSKGLLLLSLPAGLLVLALLEPRLRRFVLAIAIIATLALVPFLATPRFSDLFNTQSGTTFFRLQLWQSAWQMAVDHPWLGVGPDNFLYAYRSRYVLPGAWEELNLSHPHNLVLDLLTRLGIFGLVATAWLLAGTAAAGWRLLKSRVAPIRPIYLGLYAGLAAGLVHGLIDNSLFLVDLSVLTLFVVAVTERLARNQEPVG